MYTVIARKYRPQTFGEVVNQEHIKQTLRNALERRRIAHGYIFAGQRGTGKTTMARLMAKALNCAGGPSAEPCGQCSSCREIAAGSSVDVIEIDAASNRGIDEIRALRENVRYAPSRDPWKIYIVDEAHQITRDAWNALLKTLEEPPPNVAFIFCTTASHSIPATIVSRCQSFRFHNLGFEETLAQLARICGDEGIEATEEALAVITASAEGSLRDALSALDQAIACCGRSLDESQVRGLLGVVSGEVLDEVIGAAIEGSSERMLTVVDKLVREGHDLRNFVRELVRTVRTMLVVKAAGAARGLVEATESEREQIAAFAGNFSEDDLARMLNLTLALYSDLHHSSTPRFHTELGLLKLVHARKLIAIEELLARNPGDAGPGGATPGRGGPGGSRPSPLEADRTRKRLAGNPVPEPATPPAASVAPPTGHAAAPHRDSADAISAALLQRLEQISRSMLAATLDGARWEVEPDLVTAYFPQGRGIEKLVGREDEALIRNICSEILGRTVRFRVAAEAAMAAAAAAASSTVRPPSRAAGALPDDPHLAEFIRHIGGAVVDVHYFKT